MSETTPTIEEIAARLNKLDEKDAADDAKIAELEARKKPAAAKAEASTAQETEERTRADAEAHAKTEAEKKATIDALAAETAASMKSSPAEAPRDPQFESFKEQFAREHAKDGLADMASYAEKNIPDFAALSAGQKMLVIQGLGDKLYSSVKDAGRIQFNKRIEKSGFVGKALVNVRKKYLTAKYEKAHLSALTHEKRDQFLKDTGGELAKVIAESGLDASLKKDGSVVTNFLPKIEGYHNTRTTDAYNEKATALSRIPYEWHTKDAKPGQKKAYEKAQADFNAAKNDLLEGLALYSRDTGIENPKAFAAETVSESTSLMQMMSFLSEHPDASRELRKIGSQSALRQGMGGVVEERGAFSAAGFAARKGAYAMTGVLGGASIVSAPVTAAVIGFFRGKSRAKETLREEMRSARAGGTQKQVIDKKGKLEKGNLRQGTSIRMSDVDRKLRQLSSYKEKIEQETDPMKRLKLANELRTRTDFIDGKLELGQVNFGQEKDRFTRQYDLMRALHEARTMISAAESAEGITAAMQAASADTVMRDRVEKFGALANQRTTKARKTFVRNEALKSAFYGALFASAGEAVAHYGREFFEWYKASSLPAAKNPNIEFTQTTASDTATHSTSFADTMHAHSAAKIDTLQNVAGENQAHVLASEHVSPAVVSSTPGAHTSEMLAHVSAHKGEGGIRLIQDLKRSPGFKNLSPEARKFFDGNSTKVAMQLQELVNGKSVHVDIGSQFGVNKDGTIFLTGAHGHGMQVLGKINPDGTFTANADAHLSYAHSGVTDAHLAHAQSGDMGHAPTATVEDHVNASGAAHETAIASGREASAQGPVASPDPETQRGMLDGIAPKDHYGYGYDPKTPMVHIEQPLQFPDQVVLTPENLQYVDGLTREYWKNELDSLFGTYDALGHLVRSGADAPVWELGLRNTPAAYFMDPANVAHYRPEAQSLFEAMQTLQEKYHLEPGSMPVGEYLQKLFSAEATMRVKADVFGQLTQNNG